MDQTPENKPRKIARVVAYLRVSTDEQAASGAGLDAQRQACQRFADQAGAELVGPFADEGISGAAPIEKRPGMLAALAELRPGDALVVAKRDRLGRDPFVVAMVEASATRSRARVVSAAGEGTDDDEASSVLMRRIVDSFAEYERLLIKSRTRAAIESLRRRGRISGTLRYGTALDDDGQRTKSGRPAKLVESAAELATLERLGQLAGEGANPCEIARRLTSEGHPTRKGGPWHHNTIRGILARIRSAEPEVPTHAQA